MEGQKRGMTRFAPRSALLLLCGVILLATGAPCGVPTAKAFSDSAYILTEDISYAQIAGFDKNLTSLDVYRPKEGTGHPVLIFIHGGGWKMGDKKHYGGIGRLFSGEGYVTVNINYRLSPDVIHPAHVEDVAAAVAWVVNNIASYGGDPGRIFVMGHSAGGHLAALVATDERYLAKNGLSLATLRGSILLEGAGFDITELLTAHERLYGRMYKTAFGEDPASWADASPMNHVAPGKRIPPFLVIWAGKHDEARPQTQRFAEVLADAGVPVETYFAQGDTHGSVLTGLGRPGDVVTKRILSFLAEYGR